MKSLKSIAMAAWALAVVCGLSQTATAQNGNGGYYGGNSSYAGEAQYLPFTHEYTYTGGRHGYYDVGNYQRYPSPVVGLPGYPSKPGAVWLPSIHPVQRDPVLYQRYWPRRWYGMPGGGIAHDAPRAPVVYVPTDTTQLGFYHQRVPYWTPRANAYPTQAPNPFALHNYTPPALGYRWYYGSHYWGVPQQMPAAPSKAKTDDKKPTPAPKKDVAPPVPQALDKSAANPPFNLSKE